MSKPNISGLICIDFKGQILLTSGKGDDSTLQYLAKDEKWIADLSSHRLGVLNLQGKKILLACIALQECYAILIHEDAPATLFNFIASVDFSFDILEHLVSDPYDAVTVVDKDARVKFISPVHEVFFNIKHGEEIGKHVKEVIENTRLDKVAKSGRAEIGHLQNIKGTNRVVRRTPIKKDGEILGAIGRVMFSGPSQVEDLNKRINILEDEVEFYKREAEALKNRDYGLGSIIGNSQSMQELKEKILQVAPMDIPVLIQGESGVGKELVAQAIHMGSPRNQNRHIIVNAAALPATLVESELFGYTSGAFTGAHFKGHAGKFEQANNGTIFLDEIGDMPIEVQAKLLRVLQDNTVERLGGEKPVKLDFRLVTATNRDLEAMIADNEFRLDLYYRISPVVLKVPPLRERLEDIKPIADHFLKAFSQRHGRQLLTIDDVAVDYLQQQQWPGNIRQLKHEIERAAIFSRHDTLRVEDLSRQNTPQFMGRNNETDILAQATSLPDAVEILERRMMEQSLKSHQGNKKKVAEELDISRSYLYKKIKELNLE